MGSFSGDGTILAFLAGGAWSKIPTSLSSLELSPETELISSSELSSSLDESELDPESEPLPSDLGLFPAIWENKNMLNYDSWGIDFSRGFYADMDILLREHSHMTSMFFGHF